VRRVPSDPPSRSGAHCPQRADLGSQGNPTLTLAEIDGRQAIAMTLYLFTEGAAPGEDTELLFYRFL
jgi:hypothetical protein